ncbi:MAG TPA: serine/threonine-protein kinase [Myxococcaceae bacterium]
MSTTELGAELLPTGSQIGAWRVVSCAGQGMFGTVYRVRRAEPEAPQLFALKLAHYPNDPRFQREVELLRRIQHPSVPRLHDAGVWKHGSGEPRAYFVMDLVEGAPLYGWVAGRRVSSREVLKVVGQVARALEATHAVGGVHRDVKGDNVLVRRGDLVAVLVDFGAGTYRGAPALTWHALPPGTPHYRSPQALRFFVRWRPGIAPYEAGPADDLYALGVMAYRLVTGEYPPPHLQVEVGEREEDDTPKWVPPEQVATVSRKLAALIRQLLAVEPEARGSARQVAEAAERAARTEGRRADVPITARAARKGTALPKWAKAVGLELVRASWLAAAAVAGMVLALTVRPYVVEEGAGRQQAAQAGAQQRSTVGLAEAEQVRQAVEPTPSAENSSINREMPKEPLPSQLRAPCKAEYEEVIRGGCWVPIDKKKPPCGKDAYDWEGRCYAPSYPAGRPATSGTP